MTSVHLAIKVPDIDAALGSYDVIRVERATAGIGGPYSEITSASKAAATMLGSQTGPFTIDGESITVSIDGATGVVVNFSGTDPITIGSVVSQINAALGATIASNESNQLRLTSPNTGTASSVEITAGTAAALTALGLTSGQREIGTEEWVSMTAATSTYEFTDDDGATTYYYRVFFYNTSNNNQSTTSAPFAATAQVLLSSTFLSLATVDLVLLNGEGVDGQKISIYNISQPLQVSGYAVGLTREAVVMITDNVGHAEAYLVRGARVKVVFEGTPIVRTIDVPDAATFDLVASLSAVPDQFATALVPQLPAAPRRTT